MRAVRANEADMERTVTIPEAETHFSRLADRAHAGETIVICKGDVPWARLVPLGEPPQRVPGLLQGKVGAGFFEPLPADDLDAWEP